MGSGTSVKTGKTEKTFRHKSAVNNARPRKQTELQTDVSNKTINAMVFQQKKTIGLLFKKLTLTETNYITKN